MDGIYSVRFGRNIAGQVEVEPDGLYSHVRCRCSLPLGTIGRLWLYGENTRLNLGVLLPGQEGFILERRIPAKQMDVSNPDFVVQTSEENRSEFFVPVREGEPFAYLSKLKNSRYAVRDGIPGLLIPYEE